MGPPNRLLTLGYVCPKYRFFMSTWIFFFWYGRKELFIRKWELWRAKLYNLEEGSGKGVNQSETTDSRKAGEVAVQ